MAGRGRPWPAPPLWHFSPNQSGWESQDGAPSDALVAFNLSLSKYNVYIYHIFIHIYIERERYVDIYIYIHCTYVYAYVYIRIYEPISLPGPIVGTPSSRVEIQSAPRVSDLATFAGAVSWAPPCAL